MVRQVRHPFFSHRLKSLCCATRTISTSSCAGSVAFGGVMGAMNAERRYEVELECGKMPMG